MRNFRNGGTPELKGARKAAPQPPPIPRPLRWWVWGSTVSTFGDPPPAGASILIPGRHCGGSAISFYTATDHAYYSISAFVGLYKSMGPLIGLSHNCTCGKEIAPGQFSLCLKWGVWIQAGCC